MIFGKKSRAPALGGNETAHPADGAIREASLTAEPVLADIKYFAGDGKLDTVKKVHWSCCLYLSDLRRLLVASLPI